MANDKFMFDLRTPIAVSKEDFYLSLIDALVTELRKYTEVEIVNEQILVNFKIQREIEQAEILAKTYQQKADLLKKQLVED